MLDDIFYHYFAQECAVPVQITTVCTCLQVSYHFLYSLYTYLSGIKLRLGHLIKRANYGALRLENVFTRTEGILLKS